MSMRTSVLAGLIGLAFAFGAFGATPEGAREVPMRWRGPETSGMRRSAFLSSRGKGCRSTDKVLGDFRFHRGRK